MFSSFDAWISLGWGCVCFVLYHIISYHIIYSVNKERALQERFIAAISIFARATLESGSCFPFRRRRCLLAPLSFLFFVGGRARREEGRGKRGLSALSGW